MKSAILIPGLHVHDEDGSCMGELYRMVEAEARSMARQAIAMSYDDFQAWRSGWIADDEEVCAGVVRWIDRPLDWSGGVMELTESQRETMLAVARRAARSELNRIRRRMTRSALIYELAMALDRPYLTEAQRDVGIGVLAELQAG